jgi:hypothetical protein
VTIWFCLGALSGVGHGIGLWRAANARPSSRHWRAARLPLVAVVLIAAAVGGGLVAAAIGWASGFVVAAAVVAIRSARCIR